MKKEYTKEKALNVLAQSKNVTIGQKRIIGDRLSLREAGAVDYLVKHHGFYRAKQ